jgi:hypothetical protein
MMGRTRLVALATLGGALLIGAAAPAPAADPEANRRASANYDAVMKDRPEFRANREALECGTIESLDLRAQCIASFGAPLPRPAPEPARATLDPAHPVVTVTNGPVHNPDDDD